MQIENTYEVKECYHCCPFFATEQGGVMYCAHPYFYGKGIYEEYIITQDNSRDGKFPELCPLRKEEISITKTYKLKND